MPFGCLPVADNRRMKRALYLLLMVWIALQSAMVQAHMVEESLHQLSHTVQAVEEATSDAEQEETCAMAVCSCPVGSFYYSAKFYWDQQSCSPPSTAVPLESAQAVDDIERPKWPPAAPGVAGI